MKILRIVPLAFLFALSCNSQKSESSSEPRSIGGSKDKHGCLVGAGQSWSILQQKCLQIFSEGERLNPVKVKESEAVISTFVLFNSDKSKVELFLPTDEENIILEQTINGVYENGKYKYNSLEGALYINDVKSYIK